MGPRARTLSRFTPRRVTEEGDMGLKDDQGVRTPTTHTLSNSPDPHVVHDISPSPREDRNKDP